MSEGMKQCKQCGETKPLSLFQMRKRKTGVYPSSPCKSCLSRKAHERWVKGGKVPLWAPMRVPVEQRTPEQREAVRAYKERQRRKNGAVPREEIRLRAQERKERLEREKEARRINRELKKAAPKLSPAESFRLKYQSDPEFREKQKARTRAAKKSVPLWYANQMLGGSSTVRYPDSILKAKQIHLRIRRLLKEQFHEKH